MRRPSWASWPVLIVAAAVVLGGAAGFVISDQGPSTPNKIAGVRSDVRRQIPVGGGVRLAAEVITPRGSGRFPLVVLPASWGQTRDEYHRFAGVLAKSGYEVVAYTQRGFHGSGGEVDFAAAPTQRDVSTVIDWTLAHEPADPKRIGLFGTSYGAGVGLLAAARDARIKAVVATSTWTDFASAFDDNGTPSRFAMDTLLASGVQSGRLSDDLTALRSSLTGPALRALSPARSPQDVLARINAHHPAIMIANAWADSLAAPQQLVSFFAGLTGPKRLQLAPGDHGGPEADGFAGRRDAVTSAGRAWLDHYVKGVANGADRQPAVQLEDVVTHAEHTYPSWPNTARSVRLGPPGTVVGATASPAWTAQRQAGVDTAASTGPPAFASPAPYQPPSVALSAVDKRYGFVWTGQPLAQPTTVVGTPRLTLDVASSTGSATLFAYLYDVDATGSAALMSVTPYTVTSAPAHVSYALQPVAWTVAAGHRLALVIDTVDPRWTSVSRPGSTVTLSSSAASPSTLSVPLAR